MRLTDLVSCDVLPNKPVVPARTCSARHIKLGVGNHRHVPAYPECARCPLGAYVVEELEAGGWQRPENRRFYLSPRQLKAAYGARKRFIAERWSMDERERVA